MVTVTGLRPLVYSGGRQFPHSLHPYKGIPARVIFVWLAALHGATYAGDFAPLTAPSAASTDVIWITIILLLFLLGYTLWRLEQAQRHTKRAEAAAARWRQVLEAAPNAMIKINQEGKITLINAQAEACFGYTREELIGKSIEMLIPQRFHTNHLHFRDVFFKNPQARVMGAGRELFGLRKDGSEFPLEIGLNPIQSEDGMEVLSSVVDITERKRLEARFRLVVEATPNAVVVANENGVIELINSQTEVLFGYSRDELLGQPIDILVPQQMRAHHPSYRKNYMDEPVTRPMGSGRDLRALRKDGSEFPVEIGLNPIQTDSGMLVLSSIIDITSRKDAEQRLQQQAEEIARASRYKSEFMAKMSHELRTPLNSIMILSEQLCENKTGNLSNKQCEHAQIIYQSGRDLLELINDILDLSKIEAGRVTIVEAYMRIVDLVEGVRQTFAPLAERKQLSFQVVVDDDTPPAIQGDFQRIFQILKNLISNAIKYTHAGSVTVHISRTLSSQPPHQTHLSISVHDTGPGIPADQHSLIFQAFHQVDGSSSRQYGGTGLGLTISRQLANLLNGEIFLSSTIGKGSVFTLQLPLKLPSGIPPNWQSKPAKPEWIRDGAANHRGPANQTTNHSRTILVVDDDIRNIYATSCVLEEGGFNVQSAKNGEEALTALSKDTGIDLILMDMMMPNMDGFEATKKLRSQSCSIPIIALTAYAMKGDREKCLEVGADDYLSKPVSNAELLDTITRWLNQKPRSVDNESHR